MGKTTGISWTDATWNPIRGCSKVSDGCRHCYAESVANRFSGPGLAYEGLVHLRKADGKALGWNGMILFVERHLLDPLRWKEPRRIFVNSMSDLFHENVTDGMRDRIFAVMALCPQHTFQVLTKRPERMLAYLTAPDLWERLVPQMEALVEGKHAAEAPLLQALVTGPVLPHLWLGVSVEDQKTADARVPLLLHTPAAVRFVSAEPLRGPVNLRRVDWVEQTKRTLRAHAAADRLDAETQKMFAEMLKTTDLCKWEEGRAWRDALTGAWYDGWDGDDEAEPEHATLDWVICGGESGVGGRPMHPDWARGLRDQCVAAGVPFFFKQWGAWMHGSDFRDTARIVLNDGRMITDPAELSQEDRNVWQSWQSTMMAPVGAKAAGDELDGKQWHQYPEVR